MWCFFDVWPLGYPQTTNYQILSFFLQTADSQGHVNILWLNEFVGYIRNSNPVNFLFFNKKYA